MIIRQLLALISLTAMPLYSAPPRCIKAVAPSQCLFESMGAALTGRMKFMVRIGLDGSITEILAEACPAALRPLLKEMRTYVNKWRFSPGKAGQTDIFFTFQVVPRDTCEEDLEVEFSETNSVTIKIRSNEIKVREVEPA